MKLSVLLSFAIGAGSHAADKSLIDYFLLMPIQSSLVSNVWGAPGVFPRDPQNGLEDPTMKQWCYWDGQIVKGPDGKHHLFASRWDQARGHNGWFGSLAVHAISDNVIGPYIDRGLCWPDNQGGKGHNVTARFFRMAVTPSSSARRGQGTCLFPSPWMVPGNTWARSRSPRMSSAAAHECPT